MKKIFVLIFIFILCFSISGCKKKKTYETPTLLNIEALNAPCQNLIIFIGDGMGDEHIKAGELVYNKTYDFKSWQSSHSDTHSYDYFSEDYIEITDSAAGGTAIATGVVTVNSFVGMGPEKTDLATILDYAKSLGKSTGIVTTDNLIGATPADFCAHALDRGLADEIIETEFRSNTDILIGEYCDNIFERVEEAKECGYEYYPDFKSIEKINNKKKALCQFNFEESGGDVTLKDATKVAIDYLSNNKNGYVLMVEQAHIDKYSHNNDFENMIKCVNSLNDTVEYAKNNTSNNTGIIITADHETGDLEVSLEHLYSLNYSDVYYFYYSKSHTGKNVPLYVYGFDCDFKSFSMFDSEDKVKNKDIFYIALYAITGNRY